MGAAARCASRASLVALPDGGACVHQLKRECANSRTRGGGACRSRSMRDVRESDGGAVAEKRRHCAMIRLASTHPTVDLRV